MSALHTHARYLAQGSAVAFFIAVGALAAGERPAAKADPEDEATSIAERITREGLLAGFTGDAESRDLALRDALRVAPDYALARWHLGQMRHDDQWQTVEQIERQMVEDP